MAVEPRTGAARLGSLTKSLSLVLAKIIPFSSRKKSGQAELIGSLYEVASAVSSKLAVDDVLKTVVDETKRMVATEKAVLCLVDEEGQYTSIDASTIVVRGSRSEHPESWWRKQIEGIAEEVLVSGCPKLTLHKDNNAWLLCVPVKVNDKPIGLLSAINSRNRRFSEEQISILAILGAFAGTAIENARLVAQSQYALLASERNRISKEMHDGLAQSLFSVSLALEVCRKRVKKNPDEVEQRLEQVHQLVLSSLTELRHYIYDLRPISLERLGLAGAIEYSVHELTNGNGLRGRFEVEGRQRPLSPSAEACLYRVAQEAIMNVAKHAKARFFKVTLKFKRNDTELVVEDDGKGFDVEQAIEKSTNGHSLGLTSISDRINVEGGSLEIKSESTGTKIKVRLPC